MACLVGCWVRLMTYKIVHRGSPESVEKLWRRFGGLAIRYHWYPKISKSDPAAKAIFDKIEKL